MREIPRENVESGTCDGNQPSNLERAIVRNVDRARASAKSGGVEPREKCPRENDSQNEGKTEEDMAVM